MRLSTPTQAVARRVKELRKRRGWSAERLADECARVGMPGFNRTVIANLESGRRKFVTVDEALGLAFVLDVAPLHLVVPTEADPAFSDDRYLPVSGDQDRDGWGIPAARAWVRGEYCPPSRDPRVYFSEVPTEEFQPEAMTADEVQVRSDRVLQRRRIFGQLFPAGPMEGHGDGPQ